MHRFLNQATAADVLPRGSPQTGTAHCDAKDQHQYCSVINNKATIAPNIWIGRSSYKVTTPPVDDHGCPGRAHLHCCRFFISWVHLNGI